MQDPKAALWPPGYEGATPLHARVTGAAPHTRVLSSGTPCRRKPVPLAPRTGIRVARGQKQAGGQRISHNRQWRQQQRHAAVRQETAAALW